ncbi:long-chain fatty acid transport protein 2-like [Hyperolius riggenbachi]|uniref:long-chain fatty acid transport protein 2-like n=1 Tax=Hyperolius riggenbachi TaxID=752182 RepID=UPI0035A2E9A5
MNIILMVLLLILPLWIIVKRTFLTNLWEDFKFAIKFIYFPLKIEKSVQFRRSAGVLDSFLQHVSTRPDHKFILYQDQSYTYKEIDLKSNQAAWALKQHAKLKQGDCVAIFSFNQPAYVWIWLALAKLGCPMSCLNFNIRDKALLQCFLPCEAKVLIAAAELKPYVEEVLPRLLEQGIMVFYLSREALSDGTHSLLDKMDAASEEPVPQSFRSDISPESPALYIYTSGTTGLPKAAIISQRRVFTGASVIMLCGLTSKDVLYIPIPLYHSAGLIVGLRGCIQRGATCVLKNKFSVSQFWDDCRKYKVTAFQYIGEIVRYLCNTQKKDNDKDHCIRFAMGNGLRADVWRDFTQRFGKIEFYELYGATEGNAFFCNYSQKEGAIGRHNMFMKLVLPYEVVKYDKETFEPLRDSKGRCIRTATGEPGLVIGKIIKSNPFRGYAKNPTLTEKKIIRNAMVKGDMYFNSGDLVKSDKEGFVYFVDRTGDTFRWKGENVATTEVEDVLLTVDFIELCNVYGVSVPYHEGRIGMASITLKENRSFDGKKLYGILLDYLPNYARPRFVRIKDSMEITGTYKHIKWHLMNDGFNPLTIKDHLYFLDEDVKSYVPMDQNIYNAILEKKIKL